MKAMAVVLTVVIISSGNFRYLAHDATELTQIIEQHHAEIEEHGHAHEHVSNLIDAYHSHAHHINDHDHNVMYLPSRSDTGILLPTRIKQEIVNYSLLGADLYSLDRPPRV